ncbi:MAG: hypothetical protein E7371_01235 [Clostridiales bacterium]|nr:hypothetical protein [Clostridiales bacterium]
MRRMTRRFAVVLLSVLMSVFTCIGIAFNLPTKTAKAETILSTSGWTLAHEGDTMFRVQNGTTYWTTGEGTNVTPEAIMKNTELNGKTLTQINAEKPGAITVTMQPAAAPIGSFFRVNINTAVAGFTTQDVGTVVVRAGWSHSDSSGTYTLNSDLYFARKQNHRSQSDLWKYIPLENVVDISDMISVQDQGALYTNSRTILFSTQNTKTWGNSPATPNEAGGAFLNTLYINGKSVKQWNNEAEAMLANGEITDITFGSAQGNIKNGVPYAPIFGLNSYSDTVGSYMQVTMPTAYISNVSSFKVGKGFANLTDEGILYYNSKDVEYVRSGGSYIKVASSVDISDAFKLVAQNITASNGTMLYYLHTDNVKYWTQQYGEASMAINEYEWKNVADSAKQGGAVQMSYLALNGTPLYDINANDNGAYGATQGNIASGSKYAPILAFLTTQEMGNAIKIQVPSAYPSGSAGSEHKTLTIKKGFFVLDTATNIKYEVTRDIQWDKEDGAWVEHYNKIETNVTMATMFGSATDAFAGIALEGCDYDLAPGTYAGDVQTAKSFAQSANFLSHILINDAPLAKPGEAFLNVWGNKGYFTFRPGNNTATKITILAGCQFPTYKTLATGAKEVYVTTEDATFVKENGVWVQKANGLEAGEYETTITKVQYGKGDSNWMMFTLSDKDYPNAGTDYNIAADANKVASLNLYDKVVVDGYTVRSLLTKYSMTEPPKVNLYVEDCFAFRIPGQAIGLNGAQTVTVKAGAQFPSYEYVVNGVEAYYVLEEDVTFVNVGGTWAQQYKVTYMADGELVGESTYVYSKGETPIAPAVPEKEGYRGAWEAYTVGSSANITVHAVYTAKPISKGTTGLKEMKRIDNTSNILVINPTVSDYPSDYNLGLDVSHLQKFNLLDYVTINGQTLRSIGVSGMAINKFTRSGLGLEVNGLSNSMTIVIQEGCEIPSYEFWKNPNGTTSCYTMDKTYTCVYSAGGESAFVITSVSDKQPVEFADNYILSDLSKVGYDKTACFTDGYETLTNAEGEAAYRYGYMGSKSFTLSFDLMFTGATYYETFNVNLGTEGYEGNKYHFGWRFYLLRGSEGNTVPDQCVEYFSNTSSFAGNIPNSAKAVGNSAFVAGQVYKVTIGYKLVNESTGEVLVYTSINGNSKMDSYVLGGDFVKFAPYATSLTMNAITAGTVTVGDPGMNLNSAPYKVTLDGVGDIYTDVLTLPALNAADYNINNGVLIGWTTEPANVKASNLYYVGQTFDLTSNMTFYPVWMEFSMQSGAAVRATAGASGLRYTVNMDKAQYQAFVNSGILLETGTILAPTDYLKGIELTHDLGAGKYAQSITDKWQIAGQRYTSAFTNISYDQYGRFFSARGYLKIQYADGVKYVYTAYNADDHSRSIYGVATAAYKDIYSDNAVVKSYVNDVADLVVDNGLNVSKDANAVGAYSVSATVSGNTVTVNVSNGSVKAVVLNGVRLVMGKETSVMVNSTKYIVSEYKLNNDGLQMSFVLTPYGDLGADYYVAMLQKYVDSDVYTATNKAYVNSVATDAINRIKNGAQGTWAATYADASATLKRVKTAVEAEANNTGVALKTPVLAKGNGYTVTWNPIADADYYTVSDSNGYRDVVVVMGGEKLVYKAEVVGKHNITVTAHSYFDTFNSSAASNQVSTPEVKPVFTYKSMLDGLYKFSSSQMSTMGISTTGCYYDSNDKKYFVYYNKDLGWTPYPSQATDWTSPEEFPAHAQRLKDMGNNIILLAYDTEGMYGKNDTWANSRMKYVMDTAWSMGMKVLVCDQVFYDFSMSDGSSTAATSVNQVATAIANRNGFTEYVTHPAFYGFSLDDEPYGKYISAMSYTISALNTACENLGVDPFFLACLFQAQGGELGTEIYLSQSSLESYYNKWLAIDGVDNYLYVDIYTQHAMDQPTDRYNTSFEVIYDSDYLGGKYEFHQAITAHTQNDGVLLEQDLYMSLLYAAAHDVAGYSWFCYFPITGELAGSMVGYDGNGYGNGIGNGANGSYYEAAKTAGMQYEWIQGLLDGYDWKTRSVSGNLLTTTLSNGSKTATMYVNADVTQVSRSVTVTASGSQCYLVGYGVGTAETPYQAVSGSITLAPGQAVICIN